MDAKNPAGQKGIRMPSDTRGGISPKSDDGPPGPCIPGVARSLPIWRRGAPALGLAGGALLTYAWGGFVLTSLYGRTGAVDLVGNVVLAFGALVLLAAAIWRVGGMKDSA